MRFDACQNKSFADVGHRLRWDSRVRVLDPGVALKWIPRVIVASAATLLACADVGTVSPLPTMQSVAGTYSASLLTIQEGDGAVEDLLAKGGFIDLDLRPDGSTTGRMFVPADGPDGDDYDSDLAGTWALADSTVTLDHAADTFLRDVPLTVKDDRLTWSGTFNGVTIKVQLERE